MTIELIIIILVAWAILAYLRRDLAIPFLVVLAPAYQFRMSIADIPVTLLELLIVTTVLMFCVERLRTKKRIIVPFPQVLLALLMAVVIATIFSADVRAGLGLLKAYFLEPMALFIVAVNTIQLQRDVRRMQWAFLTLIIVISAIAFLQWSGFVPIPEPYASETPARATSVFPFPTAVGKLLGPLVAWSLVYVLYVAHAIRQKMRWQLLGFAIASMLGLFVLIVSRNRGALLGIGISCLVALFFSKRRRIVIPLVALAFVLASLAGPIRTEISQVWNRQDTSTDVRIVMWQGTLRLIQAHPIVGAGLGGFPVMYDTYRDASHVELFPNPDSLYLTLWVELGLAGVIAFFWLIGVWIRESVFELRQTLYGSLRWLFGLSSLAFVLSMLGHGLVDTPYFKNDLALIFWMMLALVYAVSVIPSDNLRVE